MKLQRSNVRVNCGTFLSDKVVDRAYRDLSVGFEEENRGVSLGNEPGSDISHAGWNIDLVNTSSHLRICPAGESVARVDNHLVVVSGDDGGKREGCTSVLAFETTKTILEEERDDSKIGVRPGALDGSGLEPVHRYLRVVQHPQLGCRGLAPFD